MEPTKTITLDGVEHEVSSFSQGIQQAIQMYNAFQADLQREQVAAVKTQAALQSLGGQIAEAIKKELADKEEGKDGAEAEVRANGEDTAS